MSGILLNKEMKSIVENEVSYYKEDLEYDFIIIRDAVKNCKNIKEFIWFTRESGTVMMRENFIKVKNSNDNISFNYWNGSIINCYRIKVEKACRANIYGSIEKLSIKKYFNEIKPKEEIYSKILGRFNLKNGKVIENIYDFSETYYRNAIVKEKINEELIESFQVLDYIK